MKGMNRTHRSRLPAIAIAAVVGYGALAYAVKLPPYELVRSLLSSSEPALGEVSPVQYPTRGRWRRAEPPPHMVDLAEAEKARAEQLRSIGYMTGSEPATGRENVTVHRAESAYQGLNLYTSGHATEALLMDMTGKVLHRWNYSSNINRRLKLANCSNCCYHRCPAGHIALHFLHLSPRL